MSILVILKSVEFTLLQAALSSMASVALGLLGAAGYAHLVVARRFVRPVLLFPNMMSGVLVVLALWISVPHFPFGLWGVVLGHLFLNMGVCAVVLGERWLEIEDQFAATGELWGAKPWLMTKRIILPQLWPQIKYCGAVVFASCLSSFVIALVLGGGPQATTLEVLAFEALQVSADFKMAALVAAVQAVLQGATFFLLLRPVLMGREYWPMGRTRRVAGTKWGLGSVFLILILALTLWPLVRLWVSAWPSPLKLEGLLNQDAFRHAIVNSLVVGVAVGLITMMALWLFLSRGLMSAIKYLPQPSGIVTGLILVLILGFGLGQVSLWLALILGHLIVVFLPVYRLAFPRLENLERKYRPSSTQLGAGFWMRARKVFAPLGLPVFLSSGVLATLWSLGEFGVSSVVAGSGRTLPLYIQSLLGAYRLEEAAAASFILVVAGLFSTILFEVLGRGLD